MPTINVSVILRTYFELATTCFDISIDLWVDDDQCVVQSKHRLNDLSWFKHWSSGRRWSRCVRSKHRPSERRWSRRVWSKHRPSERRQSLLPYHIQMFSSLLLLFPRWTKFGVFSYLIIFHHDHMKTVVTHIFFQHVLFCPSIEVIKYGHMSFPKFCLHVLYF